MSDASKKGSPYYVERRTKSKNSDKELSGYALDVSILVNAEGTYFLDDRNGDQNAMPHNDMDDLLETLRTELERNHREHFGRP
jgi:hypothetical protein